MKSRKIDLTEQQREELTALIDTTRMVAPSGMMFAALAADGSGMQVIAVDRATGLRLQQALITSTFDACYEAVVLPCGAAAPISVRYMVASAEQARAACAHEYPHGQLMSVTRRETPVDREKLKEEESCREAGLA